MPDAAALARARTRVGRICQAAQDTRTLRLQILQELRQVVGFEAYAWLLTDPETSVGTAPLADVPWLPELPRQIQLKYLTAVNRWTSLSAPVALLHEATEGDLSQSLVWRDLLARYTVSDVASAVYRDRFGCWGFLELWRSGSGARFRQAEVALLTDIAAPVTAALRRCQASTFTVRPPDARRRVGPVVLLLSPGLQVRGQTPETLAYLHVLVPPAEGRAPVPASAYNVAAQLLAIEAGVDSSPASARVHLADGLWVTVRAARLGSAGSWARDIAVTLEESSPTERVDLFARAYGLSARERELLDQLATGISTRELARRLLLTENTVQDHLKSIFAKTSAHSRRTLLARALGS